MKSVIEFKNSKLYQSYLLDKKRFKKNKEILLPKYESIKWDEASINEILEFIFMLSEIGAISFLEAYCIYYHCLINRVKNIVEIGRKSGRSTRLLAILAHINDGRVVSIDGYKTKSVERTLKRFNLFDKVFLKDSWSPWIGELEFNTIDFLFIDGDHTFMSVIVDYHYFNYYLKKGGIIGFHDSNMREVKEAVDKIIERDKLEFIETIERLSMYKKVRESGEKYFQIGGIR